MQWKKKKAVKPHEMGLYSSPQAIQTRKVWFDFCYFNMVIYTILY